MSSIKSSFPDANLQLLKTKDQGRKGNNAKIMQRHLFVLEAVFPWTELSAKDN